MELTQNLLRELFEYRDGNLYWKVSSGNMAHSGDLAGWIKKNGYRCIGINGKNYLAHRLIFFYHHSYLPKYLDHIDGNPANNNIYNLREATGSQNSMNKKRDKSYNGKTTSSEFKGVSWHKLSKKWRVRIQINKKSKHLGLFTSEKIAAKAYNDAAIKAFGEFAHINEL